MKGFETNYRSATRQYMLREEPLEITIYPWSTRGCSPNTVSCIASPAGIQHITYLPTKVGTLEVYHFLLNVGDHKLFVYNIDRLNTSWAGDYSSMSMGWYYRLYNSH